MDVLQATGEQVTIALLAIVLSDRGYPARSYLAHQVAIHTDSSFGKARIVGIETERMRADLDAGVIPVVAGFQGVDADGNVTTLGRGGSDTTGVALAAALRADECEICTDVDGVYTADPRIVDNARRLDRITFEEMLELASLGSKVLHPRSVEFAGKYQVPLRVLSSFEDGPGTLITMESDAMEQPIVSGIAHSKDEAKITMSGVPDVPGVASRILGPVSRAAIEVDMIVQNAGADGTTDFTFTVKRDDYERTLELLRPVQAELGARELSGNNKIVKVSAVGVGMRSHAGVASRMFDALAAENINILMISTSEIKISVVVAEKYLELAVRAMHDAFELGEAAAGERV
jgi:aspartate kinase